MDTFPYKFHPVVLDPAVEYVGFRGNHFEISDPDKLCAYMKRENIMTLTPGSLQRTLHQYRFRRLHRYRHKWAHDFFSSVSVKPNRKC